MSRKGDSIAAMRLGAVLAAVFLAVSARAGAGEVTDPICTDRPGKGSSTCAVPEGQWQIETGLADWRLTKTRGERRTDFKTGDTSIKYGINHDLHIEVSFEPYIRKSTRTSDGRDTETGHGDVRLKLKQELTPEGARLAVSLFPFVKLPTASRQFGNGKVEGGLAVPLRLALGRSPWSLSSGPRLAASLDGDGHGYHPKMEQNISLGVQATDRLSINTELWGSWDWDPAGTTREATLGSNVAYQISTHWQIDGEVDFGLNRSTSDIELYTGVSVRF